MIVSRRGGTWVKAGSSELHERSTFARGDRDADQRLISAIARCSGRTNKSTGTELIAEQILRIVERSKFKPIKKHRSGASRRN
jgi:hypothetical protein